MFWAGFSVGIYTTFFCEFLAIIIAAVVIAIKRRKKK